MIVFCNFIIFLVCIFIIKENLRLETENKNINGVTLLVGGHGYPMQCK